MPDYFPADVSLRVTGEIGDAQKLFPVAKQLLARAMRLKETGLPLVRLFIPGKDGSLVFVRLHQDLKHVYVQPGKVRVVPEKEVPLVPEELVSLSCPDMLSGVVAPGTGVLQPKESPEDEDIYAAHEYHPTQIVSDLYGVPYEWQDVLRLGVESDDLVSNVGVLQVRWPKPSHYSGAMKRVVQAIYGIGKTVKEGEAVEEELIVQNHYDYHHIRTYGIRKVNDSIWLVRISKAEGVHAMPLPLFECTTTEVFREALLDIGDTEMHSVVAEFGGLPTGEDFPSDEVDTANVPPTSPLQDAIAAGDVLHLMSVEDLNHYYVVDGSSQFRLSLFVEQGWAFSETGAAVDVHNTCFWYSNEAAAVANPSVWLTDGFDTLPLEDRMLRAEHWKLALTLSEINRNREEGDPIGTGSALLTQVEASLMVGEPFVVDMYRLGLSFFKVPGTGENVNTIEFWGRLSYALHELDYTSVHNSVMNITCPVFVFYIGEELEVVRHQPPLTYDGVPIRGLARSDISFGGIDPYHWGFSYIVKDPTGCDRQRYDGGWSGTTAYGAFFYDVGEYWKTDGLGFCVPSHHIINSGVQHAVHPDVFFTIDGVSVPMSTWLNPVASPSYYTAPNGWSDWGVATMDFTYVHSPVEYTINYRPALRRSGRFYSTHADLRSNGRRQGSVRASGFEYIVDYADAWEEEVGLVIPPMCREGALFIRYFGGRTDHYGTNTLLPAGVEQLGLFPGLGDGLSVFETLPAEEVNYLTSPGARWNSIWTSMLYYQFKYGASVNAGPTKCGVVADGVYRVTSGFDIALSYFTGTDVPILPLPASYLGLANGIDVSGRTAQDTTYVGAV